MNDYRREQDMYPMEGQQFQQTPFRHQINPELFLRRVRPLVRYGLKEAQYAGIRHAVTEVALIAYLMGMGLDYNTAYRMVESWEVDETFPSY